MRALFCVPFEPGGPVVPPMQQFDNTGYGLTYNDSLTGEMCGGYSCVGHVPQAPTCLVLIESSAETIAAMRVDPQYLWVEDVPDGRKIE